MKGGRIDGWSERERDHADGIGGGVRARECGWGRRRSESERMRIGQKECERENADEIGGGVRARECG